MPRKAIKKSSTTRKAKPSALTAQVVELDRRLADWGPKLDAQFVEIQSRLEALERRVTELESKSSPPMPPAST